MTATLAGNFVHSTCVVPSARLAAAWRRDAARRACAAGARAWVSAECLAFDPWLENVTRTARLQRRLPLAADFILSAAQTRALWLEAIRAAPGTDPAQGELLASLALDAHLKTHVWQLDRRPVASSLSSPEQAAFQTWHEWFEARCAQLRAAAPPELLRACVAAGFQPQHPSEFRGFGPAGPALVALGVRAPVFGPRATPPEVRVFVDQEDEFGAASDWALARRAAADGWTVAVVCPNAEVATAFAAHAARRRLALHLPRTNDRQPEPWCGAPPARLAGSAVVAHALLVLRLPARLTDAEAAALLQSPYWATAEGQLGAHAEFAARLLAGRTGGIDAHALLALARTAVPAFARRLSAVLALATSAPRRQSLQAWMLSAQQRLLAVGWPGDGALAPMEQAAVEGLRRAFETVAGLDAVLPAQSAAGAWGHLSAIAGRSGLTLPAALDAIEILTIEEAAVVAPSAAWVLSLSDGMFPAVPRPNPLLSLVALRQAGVPGCVPARDGLYQNACLSALVAQAHTCVWSYATSARDTPLRPSPALAGLARAPALARSLFTLWQARSVGVALVPRDTTPVPPLAAGELAGGVSVLRDQAACPFRAFAQHRLRAGIIEARTPGLDARERGDLVHATLAALWATVRTQAALRALSEGALQQKIGCAVDHTLAAWPGMTPPLAALESVRLGALVREWLVHDSARPPFEVLAWESPHELALGGLRLQIRIDRLDLLADGRVLVIDYKTGDSKRRDWLGPRPSAPQLLLYALAEHPAALAGIAIAGVQRGKCGFITEPKGLLDTTTGVFLEAQVAQWRGVLEALAGNFMAGDARVDPVRGAPTCRHCNFKSLCRIDERTAGDLSGETEGEDDDA